MEKIKSFMINHLTLKPGLYVSRVDVFNGCELTTYDLRFTRPNFEPVMDTSIVHAIEHLGATFFRNDSKIKEETVYFGPMGCRTGFYLILANNDLKIAKEKVKECMEFIIMYEGKVPGASKEECGNYLDINLDMAKYYAKKFLEMLDK